MGGGQRHKPQDQRTPKFDTPKRQAGLQPAAKQGPAAEEELVPEESEPLRRRDREAARGSSQPTSHRELPSGTLGTGWKSLFRSPEISARRTAEAEGKAEPLDASEETSQGSVSTPTQEETTAESTGTAPLLSASQGAGVVDEAINAAERLNRGQSQIRRLDPSELQEVAAGLQETSAVKQLASAGEKALAALEEDERKEREGVDSDWRERLLAPAQQLLDGLDPLLNDEKLWEQLRASETATAVLNQRSGRVLREVVDLNLQGLLEGMGTRPAQAERLAGELKSSLDDLFEGASDEATRAVTSRRAQQHIAHVTHRLRGAITAAERERTSGDGGPGPGATHRDPLRTRLRAAMRAGAEAAVPAALAAGAVSVFFPSPDHTGSVIGAIAAGVATKELLRQGVQLAATGLMGRLPIASGAPATAAERFQGARTRVDSALSDLIARFSSLKDPSDSTKERLAEYLRIESTSAVYGLLQAQTEHAPTGHYAVRAVTDSLLESLREAGNLIGTLDRHPDDLAAMAQRLESQRQKLQEAPPRDLSA